MKLRTTLRLLPFLSLLVGCNQRENAGDSASLSDAPELASMVQSEPVAQMKDTLTDSELIARADAGRLMGRDSGAIWLIMVSDFQCPYCKQWHDSSFVAVQKEFVETGKVRMAYLNLPLPQHPRAQEEAEASLCAAAQGKFWPYADGLFKLQQRVAATASIGSLLDSLARANSLAMPEFAHCRRSSAIKSLVRSDVQQANQIGVQSTPTFVIGEFLLQGAAPLETFRRAIDTALVVARKKAKEKR